MRMEGEEFGAGAKLVISGEHRSTLEVALSAAAIFECATISGFLRGASDLTFLADDKTSNVMPAPVPPIALAEMIWCWLQTAKMEQSPYAGGDGSLERGFQLTAEDGEICIRCVGIYYGK